MRSVFRSSALSNDWNPRANPLESRGASGIWEGFVAGVQRERPTSTTSKARNDGYKVDKTDPFAFMNETPPHTASIVWISDYEWNDGDWMKDRARRNSIEAPMSIYEIHLGRGAA